MSKVWKVLHTNPVPQRRLVEPLVLQTPRPGQEGETMIRIGVSKTGQLTCLEFYRKRPAEICRGKLVPVKIDRFVFLHCKKCGHQIHTLGVCSGGIHGVDLWLKEYNSATEASHEEDDDDEDSSRIWT